MDGGLGLQEESLQLFAPRGEQLGAVPQDGGIVGGAAEGGLLQLDGVGDGGVRLPQLQSPLQGAEGGTQPLLEGAGLLRERRPVFEGLSGMSGETERCADENIGVGTLGIRFQGFGLDNLFDNHLK